MYIQRAVGSVCRSVAYRYAVSKDRKEFQKVKVDDSLIKEALGNPKYDFKMNERITKPGVAIGLAYTEVGGRALLIETTKY